MKEQQRRRCPLCRATIPPSREEIASMKIDKSLMLMKGASDPCYKESARRVKEFEAEYGEDWDGIMVEYENDFVSLPSYVNTAASQGNVRTVLQWLGKGSIKERVNAKCEDIGNTGLLLAATMGLVMGLVRSTACDQQHDLMSYMLLNGADVNALDAAGMSVLIMARLTKDYLETVSLLLSWGAEFIEEGKQITRLGRKLGGLDVIPGRRMAIAKLISSELGGRRCEIISAPGTRDDLIGKTCVVDEYIVQSDQYKVAMEFTNEVLLVGADKLKRRDRTPQDPGYYVECKNNRLIRRDFKSNEECQAFIASLGAEKGESAEVDPDAENKAEQAAADLLAELGLEDLEGPSIDASDKGKQPVAAGKKKKRGGKKKGRK